MKMLTAFAGLLLWAAPLMAETYSWVDENGTYNFTEDLGSVPKKYRRNVKKRGDTAPAPQPKEAPAGQKKPVSGEVNAEPVVRNAGSSFESIGGKSYGQWVQEFSEREAALAVQRKRIEEYDAVLTKPLDDTPANRALLQQRNSALQQYNDMRKQYDQQVEAARKAGINIDVK